MKKKDVDTFIEEMKIFGDEWTPELVEDVYGDFSVEAALVDRKAIFRTFFDIIGKFLTEEGVSWNIVSIAEQR